MGQLERRGASLIVFNPAGEVLVLFDGQGWALPYGQPRPGQDAVVVALRVLRRRGVRAGLVAGIPFGTLPPTGNLIYVADAEAGQAGDSQAARWVSPAGIDALGVDRLVPALVEAARLWAGAMRSALPQIA
jgi:hypothetical protein